MIAKCIRCIASIAFALLLSSVPAILFAADKKVDCGKILTEIQTGSSAQAIAKTMGISPSVVYRCEQQASRSIPSASSSPRAMPNPSVLSH